MAPPPTEENIMGFIIKNGIPYGGSGGFETSVPAKTDLYNLTESFKRGMIVYVIDEDKYYRLINDLPGSEASWVEAHVGAMEEITEAEIDAMFE